MLGRLTAAAGSAVEAGLGAASAAVTELTAAEEDNNGGENPAATDGLVSPQTQQGVTKKKLESATREDLVVFVKKQAMKMKSLEGMGAELAQERRALDARIVGKLPSDAHPAPERVFSCRPREASLGREHFPSRGVAWCRRG